MEQREETVEVPGDVEEQRRGEHSDHPGTPQAQPSPGNVTKPTALVWVTLCGMVGAGAGNKAPVRAASVNQGGSPETAGGGGQEGSPQALSTSITSQDWE